MDENRVTIEDSSPCLTRPKMEGLKTLWNYTEEKDEYNHEQLLCRPDH